jgi:glyoxylase-like metal-dependent hydrolase (beta-lactamase superfamily II)
VAAIRSFVEIAPDVFVGTAPKYTTTSTIVVRDGRAVIVDPAWTEADLDGIRDHLRATGLELAAGVSTHSHYDHVLWHPDFGDVPRWGSVRTFEDANKYRAEILESMRGDIPDTWPHPVDGLRGLDGRFVPDPFANGSEEEIEFILHDGHAPGHTAVWLPARGVVAVGDMLSDIELPMPFSPDDLDAYLDGLDRLADVVGRASVLVPGHGSVTTEPLARLDADRRYLDDVLHRRTPDDERMAFPEQDVVHAHIQQMVAQRG